jgi:nicotinamide riboside transporter PnuC
LLYSFLSELESESGMAIYETIKQSLVNTGAIITWIGAIVGLAGMFRIYFKEKSEEKKTPKLAFGEGYKLSHGS